VCAVVCKTGSADALCSTYRLFEGSLHYELILAAFILHYHQLMQRPTRHPCLGPGTFFGGACVEERKLVRGLCKIANMWVGTCFKSCGSECPERYLISLVLAVRSSTYTRHHARLHSNPTATPSPLSPCPPTSTHTPSRAAAPSSPRGPTVTVSSRRCCTPPRHDSEVCA
jgi:hypothetical protein